MTPQPSDFHCLYCYQPIHWHLNGWLHDHNNMATCLWESEKQRRVIVAEPMEKP